MTKAEKLENKWDEGCENDSLDPGDVFGETISYCHKLENTLLKAKEILQKEWPKQEWSDFVEEIKFPKSLNL